MRFLSILRIAKHQRFNIEPRYYDKVREDIEQRTSRIKRELKLERRGGAADTAEQSRINGAFSKNKRHEATMTGVLRMFLIFIISGQFFGFYYFGPSVFYTLLLAIPAYYLIARKVNNQQ
jgi:hypothetical protein